MEKKGYRDNLMMLREMFPNRTNLKLSEVASVMGLDARTVKRRYSEYFTVASSRVYIISIADLARAISR